MNTPKDYNENISEQLSGLIDGELSPELAEALAEKVGKSPELQAELEALKRTRELLGDLPSKNAPAGFCDDILEQVERGRLLKLNAQPRKRRSSIWGKMAASAAIVAITGGLLMYISDAFRDDDWVSRQEKLNSNLTVTLADEADYDISKGKFNSKDYKSLPEPEAADEPAGYKLSLSAPRARQFLRSGMNKIADSVHESELSSLAIKLPAPVTAPPAALSRTSSSAKEQNRTQIILMQNIADELPRKTSDNQQADQEIITLPPEQYARAQMNQSLVELDNWLISNKLAQSEKYAMLPVATFQLAQPQPEILCEVSDHGNLDSTKASAGERANTSGIGACKVGAGCEVKAGLPAKSTEGK